MTPIWRQFNRLHTTRVKIISDDTMVGFDHHYAVDAAKQVDRCRSLLHSIIDEVGTHSSSVFYLTEVADGK